MKDNSWLDNLGNDFDSLLDNTVSEITHISNSIEGDVNHHIGSLNSYIEGVAENFPKDLESLVSDFRSEFIKPTSLELRNAYRELGITQEIDQIYKELNISSDEEFLEIICALIAAGVTVSLVLLVASYLESGALLVDFSFLPFLEEYNRQSKLDKYRLQQLNILLSEIENQTLLNTLYQERFRRAQGLNNQFFIDRKTINTDNRYVSVSDNTVLPVILTYLDKMFNGETDWNQYKQVGNFGIGSVNRSNLQGNIEIAGIINETGDKSSETRDKILVEAAAEIEYLLEKLEKLYPIDNTTNKEIIATEAIKCIENDPELKSKIQRALKVGGISTLEQLLSHPSARFVINALDDWQ